MLVSQESAQKILDFQKDMTKELKRPITYSEAIAMYFYRSDENESLKAQDIPQNWQENII